MEWANAGDSLMSNFDCQLSTANCRMSYVVRRVSHVLNIHRKLVAGNFKSENRVK